MRLLLARGRRFVPSSDRRTRRRRQAACLSPERLESRSMLAAGQAIFNPTGGPQDWEIPEGVKSASITLVGGLGGHDDSGYTFNMPSARVEGTLTWPAGTTALDIWVGGNGGNATGTDSPGTGGFNGGAAGGTGSESSSAGGGGGGATDIRIGGYLPDTRVMVAGGSGGAGGSLQNGPSSGGVGGDGGTGGAGTATAGVWPAGNGADGSGTNPGKGGAGGQIPDGQSTVGGNAGTLTNNGGGGGGAGGYLGGWGGQAGTSGLIGDAGPGGGGGGGSSYADPTLVTNATASLADNIFTASARIRWVHIATASIGSLEEGVATQQQLVATYPDGASTLNWQVTHGSLPAGLTLSNAGEFSGTPTSPGNYSFTVTVTAQPNAVATSTRTYTVTVSSGVQATQSGSDLSITVNGGRIAYVRRVGTLLEVAANSGFSQSQQFVASTVSTVTVTGAAANAGFVLTAGTVNASLATSNIASLSFNASSSFTGAVQAALTGGPLVVSNAIRSSGSVTLDADLVLATDVEIEAGSSGATITGTVDGQSRGGQSLVVTSLGPIVFEQAVGAGMPLERLETRATAPLVLSTDTSQSRTIPLHYLPYTTPNGMVEDKYGIEVAIGTNPARMYEFDTGGTGFWAGYNPEWWQGVVPAANAAFMHNKYTSGNYFDGLATSAVLTIGSGMQKVSTGGAVQLVAITSGGNDKTGATFDFSTALAPPIEGHFFGDFGASFGIGSPAYAVENPPQITNPLFQLPGNLSSGFVVQLGPLGTTPRLVVGLTDDLRAQFPTAIPLDEIAGLLYPNPNGAAFRRQAYEQFAFAGEYSLLRDGETVPLGTVPTLIDSGAPTMTVHYPVHSTLPDSRFVSGGVVTAGTTFTGVFPPAGGATPFTWSFAAGSEASVDLIDFTTAGSAASAGNSVNTGLNFYNSYDVMFDVAAGFLRVRPSGGSSSVQLQSVTTTGGQRYGQNATLSGVYSTGGGEFFVAGATTLAGHTVVNAGSGSVTFSGTVDGTTRGGQSLDINSRGQTRFVRPVGGRTPLANLTTDAGGTTTAVSVATEYAQTYGDDVSLNGQYTASLAPFAVWGSTTLQGPVSVTANSKVTLNGRIDSIAGKGFPLTVSAGKGDVYLNAAVGSTHPLGGLAITWAGSVRAASTITLDGSLPSAATNGLTIGFDVTATFAAGGSIRRFAGSGVVFERTSLGSELRGFTIADNVYDGIQVAATALVGEVEPEPVDYTNTVIAGNTIFGNGGFGIELARPTIGLSITGNTIGRQGTTNPWNYVSGGPNTHGIVLAPGESTGTRIADNTIRFSRRSGIMAAGGVQGVSITGNTLERNAAHGIEFTTGDFTGTTITANTIRLNGSAGISLGAGIGQGTTTGGNPDAGYAATVGHYLVAYANNPDFYDEATPPADPKIAMQVGTTQLAVNLDTGSRGLYFDALQLDPTIRLDGPKGHVFLNSSNRLYFGQWSTQTITFTQSSYVGPGGADTSRKATAKVPILVVTAIGASTTPAPGTTVANTTFGTTIASGTITITNGRSTRTVGIVPNASGGQPAGTVTIPGGWWATYADNMASATTSKLAPVANFGIGFDRSGQGTAPTTDSRNQLYNAFLNLTEMQAGTMRPGYVISATGVQLGLDSSVSHFAYTDLAPTGLPQGTQSAPDWQPATGTVEYQGTTSGTGQIVIDMGIPSGILTLPGYTPSSKFGGTMKVNLLNSGGDVHYDIDLANTNNLLNPTEVAFFNPLAGTYSENLPPQSQQFFNTGRKVFAAFDYLYDAAAGFFGLRVGQTPAAQAAFAGRGQFAEGFYPNPNAPTGVTNLSIGGTQAQGNTIANNGGNGVTVTGTGSTGNAILSNSIFGNGRLGIDLVNGGNASQVAPVLAPTVRLVGEKTIAVSGSLAATAGFLGTYRLQFFASPYADGRSAAAIEGRTLLGEINVAAGPFTATLSRGTAFLGDWITVTATPNTGAANTSEFSRATRVMTLVVDTAADAGTGSLRSAMTLANANPGSEAIEFGIPSTPRTIAVRSALPAITGSMVIDGRTQPVTVSGARLASAANGFTVAASAPQTQIWSLTVAGFSRGAGIWSAAANTWFEGNTLVGNWNGISLAGGTGATVSGNAITASGNWGIVATGGLTGASVVGNTITGTGLVGIYLRNATGLVVGRAGAGNTITGGAARGLYSTGIYVTGAATGSRVQANTVSDNGSGVMLVDARGVLLGGPTDADRNTITGNRGYGLLRRGATNGTVVQRNVISGNGRNVS